MGSQSHAVTSYRYTKGCRVQHAVWRTYALLVQSDLFCEALLGKVAHCIVVRIGEEMSQMVLGLGILLHVTNRGCKSQFMLSA